MSTSTTFPSFWFDILMIQIFLYLYIIITPIKSSILWKVNCNIIIHAMYPKVPSSKSLKNSLSSNLSMDFSTKSALKLKPRWASMGAVLIRSSSLLAIFSLFMILTIIASTINFLSAFSSSMAFTSISPLSLLVTRSSKPPLGYSWTSYKMKSLPFGIDVTNLLVTKDCTAPSTSSSLYPVSQRQPVRESCDFCKFSRILAPSTGTKNSLLPPLNLMLSVTDPTRGLQTNL